MGTGTATRTDLTTLAMKVVHDAAAAIHAHHASQGAGAETGVEISCGEMTKRMTGSPKKAVEVAEKGDVDEEEVRIGFGVVCLCCCRL